MFLVETLLNLVIYIRNVCSKTQKLRFPFVIISTIVPNNTRIYILLKVALLRMYVSTILYKNEQRKIPNRSQK